MVKRIVLISSVVFIISMLFLGFKYFLPYGRLDKKSNLCQETELIHNQIRCRLSGCIWGSGDLAGMPFCGAYR